MDFDALGISLPEDFAIKGDSFEINGTVFEITTMGRSPIMKVEKF